MSIGMASSSIDNADSPSSVQNHFSGTDEKHSRAYPDEQYRKLFIGGLNYTTTDEKLQEYCSNYGDILECTIMRDREGRSRGFAFVSFKDHGMVDNFMSYRPHTVDGRQIEPKRAMPRDEASKPEGQLTVKKLFIGGIKEELTEDNLKAHFETYGKILECKIMKDKEDKFRGFAFITFDDYDSVDRCILEKPHIINGKELDVRKAIPREQTPRINVFNSHNTQTNLPLYNDIYQTQNRFQTQLMINNSQIPLPLFPPYAYFSPTNYLSKPIPLMGSANNCSPQDVLASRAIILPQNVQDNGIYRNQTMPSAAQLQTKDSRKIGTTSNGNKNQTNIDNTPNNDQLTTTNDTDKVEHNHVSNSSIGNNSNVNRSKARNLKNDPSSEQHRKLFIGGLSFKTTDETLKEYVTKFGEVSDSLVMKDQNGQSRCFGFVTFVDIEAIDDFMKKRPHAIDGRQIDPKRAMPREEANNDEVHLTVKKIFIGGIRDGLDENKLKLYFEKFGQVNDCFLMHDKDGKKRGFAFLEFDDFDSVDKVILNRPHTIDEYRIDVKKAVPKDQKQMQLLQQQQQQQQQLQQQQYVLQLQAAATYQYYYNNPSFNILTNGNCTLPVSSPSSLMNSNIINNVGLDDNLSRNRTSKNNNNISNSFRYVSTRNNRRQSSLGSQ